MDDAYLPILKRVGLVLVIVGLLDIGQMIYCIVHGINYSSSLNIFAVIAGIFLIRGSLRTAGHVLWYATFGLTAFCILLAVWPLFLSPRLVGTAVRLYPLWSLISLVFVTAVLGLFYWVVSQLGSESVLAARVRSGRRIRSLRSAVIAGVGLVAILGLAAILTLNGERAGRAKAAAALQIGPGYEYQVTSMRVLSGSDGTDISAVVTAWNNREIRRVPVHWTEQ
jgi:hypothetical protein